MEFRDVVTEQLAAAGLFQNFAHRMRFQDLLDCFSDQPFFNKGICKCMFMSAWDEEHFAVLVGMLNYMRLGKDLDDSSMVYHGDAYAEEADQEQSPLYRLSVCYISGEKFVMPEDCPEETKKIIEVCNKAEKVIDSLEL